MSQFQLNLAESELKIILESLVEMEQKMAKQGYLEAEAIKTA